MAFGLLGVSGDDSAGTSDEEATATGTMRTVRGASEQAMTFGRSWWSLTTDTQYLTSRASRRDLWAVLLPLTALIPILFDAPKDVLIVLDACLALVLVATTWLPVAHMWSDAVIACICAAFVMGREVVASDAEDSFEYCQVVFVFSMVSAGVHSVAVGGFLLVSTLSAPLMQTEQHWEVFISCSYMLFLNVVMERRIAQIVLGASTSGGIIRSGYKALDLTGVHFETRFPDTGGTRAPPGPVESDVDTSRGPIDGNLDMPQGASLPTPSSGLSTTSSFARLWSGLSFSKPASASQVPRKKPAQRFEAFEVHQPTAQEHQPPEFADDGRQAHRDEAESLLGHGRDDDWKASPGTTPMTTVRDEEHVLRGVKLTGFSLPALNVLFVERRGPTFVMNDRETYWTAANDYFMYYSKTTNTWGVAKAKRFQQVKHGQSHGYAHSPEGNEIWDKAESKGWREWDPQANQWVMRSEGGVESRGKVRPMTAQTPKVDVGVQTDFV